jgi:hypothetical protein
MSARNNWSTPSSGLRRPILPPATEAQQSAKIQIDISITTGSDSALERGKSNDYELKLAGLHHRIAPSDRQDGVLLHFDYMIELVEKTAPPEKFELPPLPQNFTQLTFIEARSMSMARGHRALASRFINTGASARKLPRSTMSVSRTN